MDINLVVYTQEIFVLPSLSIGLTDETLNEGPRIQIHGAFLCLGLQVVF